MQLLGQKVLLYSFFLSPFFLYGSEDEDLRLALAASQDSCGHENTRRYQRLFEELKSMLDQLVTTPLGGVSRLGDDGLREYAELSFREAVQQVAEIPGVQGILRDEEIYLMVEDLRPAQEGYPEMKEVVNSFLGYLFEVIFSGSTGSLSSYSSYRSDFIKEKSDVMAGLVPALEAYPRSSDLGEEGLAPLFLDYLENRGCLAAEGVPKNLCNNRRLGENAAAIEEWVSFD